MVKEIKLDYEEFDMKYSNGWIWGGKEAVISEVEDGFYKLPSKFPSIFISQNFLKYFFRFLTNF